MTLEDKKLRGTVLPAKSGGDIMFVYKVNRDVE